MPKASQISEDFLFRIIGDIHDTVFDPDKWHEIFHTIGDRTDTLSFLFGIVGYDGEIDQLGMKHFDNDRYDILVRRYTRPEVNPVVDAFIREPVGTIFSTSERFNGNFEKLDVANDVFVPQDIVFSLCVPVARGPDFFAPLSIMRSRRQGDFDAQDVALHQRFLPHMSRALHAYIEFGKLRRMRADLEDVLDTLGCGVALLGADGEVMFLNASARALVDRRDGLAFERGRLIAAGRAERGAFASLVGRAASRDPRVREGGAMMLSLSSSCTPLPCVAVPIGEDAGRSFFHRAPAALLLLGRAKALGTTDDGPLTRLYGLSGRQAQLAALLLEGRSLPAAAKALGVSLNTAKTHLNRSLAKIGAANLGELDRLILRGPLGVLKDPTATPSDRAAYADSSGRHPGGSARR